MKRGDPYTYKRILGARKTINEMTKESTKGNHMKSKYLLLAPLLVAASLTSCDGEPGPVNFGLFGHNGVYLTQYAVAKVSLSEAKSMIDIDAPNANPKYRSTHSMDLSEENETIRSILTRFGSLTATVKYYVSGEEEQQVRTDLYQGTELLYLLKNNSYSPFAQMAVKYIYLDDGLLDELEEVNRAYKEDLDNLISPFDSPYTYHKDERGELVIQTHHFAELPSVINGGIGSTFLQDCELKYDAEGKIEVWQSSLGLYTTTPTGTSLEGYIFEAAFAWALK